MARKDPLCVLRWQDGQCIPPSWRDKDALSKLEEGALLNVYPYRPNSTKQEGYLRALWRLGEESHRDGAAFTTADAIKNECKRIAGAFDGFIVRKGQAAQMNFKNTPDLDAEELKALVDVTIAFLLEEVLLPGTNIDALREEAKARAQRRKF